LWWVYKAQIKGNIRARSLIRGTKLEETGRRAFSTKRDVVIYPKKIVQRKDVCEG